MNRSTRRRPLVGLIAMAAFAAIALASAGSASAAATVVYDSDSGPLPGNVASLGYEATSTQEFGAEIGLAGSARKAVNLRFLLSSWGCESGGGTTCTKSAGATFPVDITATFYEVGNDGEPGDVVLQKSKTLPIPYRPTANNKKCNGGRWYQSSTASCFNGKAVRKSIPLGGTTVLPDDVIVSLAYNTTHHGYNPIGESAPCYTSDGGCGYDSLNFGVDNTTPTVGTQPNPDDGWWNTTVGGFYCDGGAGGTGTFRLDDDCWTGFQPYLKLTAK